MKTKPTAAEIEAFIESQIRLFDKDPASSSFQKGYIAALKDTLSFVAPAALSPQAEKK